MVPTGRTASWTCPPPWRRLASRWHDVGPWRIHSRQLTDRAPAGAPWVVLVHGLGVSGRYLAPLRELVDGRLVLGHRVEPLRVGAERFARWPAYLAEPLLHHEVGLTRAAAPALRRRTAARSEHARPHDRPRQGTAARAQRAARRTRRPPLRVQQRRPGAASRVTSPATELTSDAVSSHVPVLTRGLVVQHLSGATLDLDSPGGGDLHDLFVLVVLAREQIGRHLRTLLSRQGQRRAQLRVTVIGHAPTVPPTPVSRPAPQGTAVDRCARRSA